MKAYINEEIMKKAYALHKKGVDNATIAQVLACSKPTVERIARIMKIAETGDVEALASIPGHARMVKRACEIYGIEPVNTSDPHDATPADARPERDSDAIIIDLLKRQNALLERFCAAFGVDTETKYID